MNLLSRVLLLLLLLLRLLVLMKMGERGRAELVGARPRLTSPPTRVRGRISDTATFLTGTTQSSSGLESGPSRGMKERSETEKEKDNWSSGWAGVISDQGPVHYLDSSPAPAVWHSAHNS